MASWAEQQWHNLEVFISGRMEVDLTQRKGSGEPGLKGLEMREHLQRQGWRHERGTGGGLGR